MPKCPYCSEELRLKLSAIEISEIDPTYSALLESSMESLPRWLRRLTKSHLSRIQEYSPLVQLIVCAYCDSVLNATIQNNAIRSMNNVGMM
jgi:hypothetical protein